MSRILIYWKYREGNKLLALSPNTSWYLTCEPDTKGNYMLILFANQVKMIIDDGYMYSITGPEMDDSDLRDFYNAMIDNTASIVAQSPKILNLEEIRTALLSERFPDWAGADKFDIDDDDDDDDDYSNNDYDYDEEYY